MKKKKLELEVMLKRFLVSFVYDYSDDRHRRLLKDR